MSKISAIYSSAYISNSEDNPVLSTNGLKISVLDCLFTMSSFLISIGSNITFISPPHVKEKLELTAYERNLYNAQARDNRSEIDHWERTIDGLRQEAANRGIRI